jgi:hypothetical protein
MKTVFQLSILILLVSFGQEKYIPDTNINGVELMDGKSFDEKFKSYKLPEYYDGPHPPKLEFINVDKTQKFTVFHCYGAGKNDICTFRVEFRKRSDSIPFYGIQITDKTFKTE